MKRILFILLAAGLWSGTGCAAKAADPEQEVEEMGAEAELSEEKKLFLKKISVDEDRIDEGKLYDWQEELLKQYDYVLGYLGDKYPSHQFQITDCEPESKMNDSAVFWFTADAGEDLYELYLTPQEEERYLCQDNYYGYLVKSSYDSALTELIREEVPECAGVSSSFNTAQNEKYDENLTGEDILNNGEKLTNSTKIFILAEDETRAEKLIESVQEVLAANHVYGSYRILALDSLPDGEYDMNELEEYIDNDQNSTVILKQNYNQFD